MARPEAQTFVTEAYRHAKPIGALGEGAEILTASPVGRLLRSLAGTKDGTAPAQGVQNLSEVGAMSLTAGAAETLATHGILIGQAGRGQDGQGVRAGPRRPPLLGPPAGLIRRASRREIT